MSLAPQDPHALAFEIVQCLLDEHERGAIPSLDRLLERFPGAEEIVRREYTQWTRASVHEDPSVDGSQRTLGPYRLVREIGAGGQGVVFLAEDSRLPRTVALKMLAAPFGRISEARRERFRREAAVIARLDHPGLCSVYEVELEGTTPYIAMRFAAGETLSAHLERARRGEHAPADLPLAPRTRDELARLLVFFESLAAALHAAHEAGVVHRDLKPSNVIVSPDGRPIVLDFGLALDELSSAASLTGTGELFGTPGYMSPEQLSEARPALDRRTDVYSLATMLHECLTLARPFEAPTHSALARAIRFDPPPDPRAKNDSLPRDLVLVLEQALEKDVRRRTSSTELLASELRRVREYLPVLSRAPGPLRRLGSWTRRHPKLAFGSSATLLFLVGALAISLIALDRVRTESDAREAALELFRGGYYRDLSSQRLPADPARALHLALEGARHDPGYASNMALLSALSLLHEMRTLVGHTDTLTCLDVSPSDGRVASVSVDGTLRVWDPATGRESARASPNHGALWCVRFSRDGRRLVTTASDGTAQVWSASDLSRPFATLAGHTDLVRRAEFSADGERVLTASYDGTARVWNVRDATAVHVLGGHGGIVTDARFVGGDDFVLAVSGDHTGPGTPRSGDGQVTLHRLVGSGASQQRLLESSAIVRSVATSRDGRWIALGTRDGRVSTWSLDPERSTEPHARWTISVPNEALCLAFDPAVAQLAIGYDAGARIVGTADGATLRDLADHGRRAVAELAWSANGDVLASAAYDGKLRLWDGHSARSIGEYTGRGEYIRGLAWSPDGAWLAAWYSDPRASLWHAYQRPYLIEIREPGEEFTSARFDASGERIVTRTRRGHVEIFDSTTGRRVRALAETDAIASAPPEPIAAVFSADDRTIVAPLDAHRVGLWNASDGKLSRTIDLGDGRLQHLALACDGSKLVVVPQPGNAQVWRLPALEPVSLPVAGIDATCAAFAPDVQSIAVGYGDGSVGLHRFAANGDAPRERWHWQPTTSDDRARPTVFSLAFSRDGSRLAVASQSRHCTILDIGTGRQIADLDSPTLGRIAFSSDGRHLFAGSRWVGNILRFTRSDGVGTAERWELAPLQGRGPMAHASSVTALVTAANGCLAATASLDRTAKLWDLDRGECLVSFAGHGDAIFDLDLSPSCDRVVTASADGTVRIWPTDLVRAAELALPVPDPASYGPLPEPSSAQR